MQSIANEHAGIASWGRALRPKEEEEEEEEDEEERGRRKKGERERERDRERRRVEEDEEEEEMWDAWKKNMYDHVGGLPYI